MTSAVALAYLYRIGLLHFTTQNNWRWRNDSSGESPATWKAAQNKPIIAVGRQCNQVCAIGPINATGDVKD